MHKETFAKEHAKICSKEYGNSKRRSMSNRLSCGRNLYEYLQEKKILLDIIKRNLKNNYE